MKGTFFSKPIEYKLAYNDKTLLYLEKKYGNMFRDELKNVCWCNSY